MTPVSLERPILAGIASLRRVAPTLGWLLVAAVVSSCGGGSSSLPPIYTAIFDAGSGGTRLTFYRVTPSQGGYPVVHNLGSFDQDADGVVDDDGINDFLNDRGSIKLSGEELPQGCPGSTALAATVVGPCVLQPLLTQLDSAIAAENARTAGLNLQRSQVRVELFATAGMRTEDSINGGAHASAAIAAFYASMRAYVSQQGFAAGDFRTINGNSEEGVWTWINLNDYYYNAFDGNSTKTRTPQTPEGKGEVGGSSLQIVFPVQGQPSEANNIYAVSINGKSFRVFSKTYLGLGADDTRKYVKAMGYQANDGGASCYATTATAANTREGSGIQLYPANQVSAAQAYPFPSNSVLSAPWTSVNPAALQLRDPSTFDYGRCADKYNTIVSQVMALPRNRDGSDHNGPPSSVQSLKSHLQASIAPLVGINGFYFPAADVAYAPVTGFDGAQFKSRLLTYCAGAVANRRMAQNICPDGVFMHEFLFGPQGLFGATGPAFAGVHSTKDNGQTVLTWTRGYLLWRYSQAG